MSGVRVVRGPDWDWGEQDGGEGFVGTVVWQEEGSGKATVQWDTTNRHPYFCGYGAKYDLRALDTAPAGVQHEGWSCNWCSVSPISGTRWQCVQCRSYSLCSECYHSGKHCLEHEFVRFNGADSQHVRVGSRTAARRVMSRGIFKGAVVMRGADWRWEDQDGGIGCRGKVCAIEGWEKTSFRSVAHVMWSHSQVLNIYCIGHNGLVDLQCVQPAPGGLYYPQHLPVLDHGPTYTGEERGEGKEEKLRTGDIVRIELDPGEFKTAQEYHGRWEDYMAEYIGCDGVVHAIYFSGDVVVRYKNGRILEVNSQCLSKVEGNSFECGDLVRVSDDMATVHRLQTGHGEWTDDIALSLGQVGRVMKINANGDIRVAVNGSRWILNPNGLTPAPGETPIEEQTGLLHVDLMVRIQTLSLSEASCPDVVVVAAAGGDLDSLTKYLRHHPEYVDTMYEGNTALHAAAAEGYLPIMKFLLSYRANLNKKDEGEHTALQLCIFINCVEGARLLVDSGADPNIGDDGGITPLARAAALGYVDIVEVLLDCHRTNPNKQDLQGNTPLHRAIFTHQLQSVIALLSAGADPTIPNHTLHNCMHRAAAIGFLAGVEELIKWHPNLIKIAKKDGFTPLHMAAATGHTDIVSVLLSHPSCDVGVEDTDGLTPLHLAAHGGHTAMVERLVGYGADLNAATSQGNTALHLTLVRRNMAPPSLLSPHILEVKKELDQTCGVDTLRPEVVVGVFLVREGAQIHAANRLGLHPLSLQPPDVVQLFTRYSTPTNTKHQFHGTLGQKDGPFADMSPKTPRKPLKVESREKEPSSSSTVTSPPPHSSSTVTSPPPPSSSTVTSPPPHSSSTVTSPPPHSSSTVTSPPPPSSSSPGSSTQSVVTPVTAPRTSAVDRSVNEYTPTPVLTYGKDINPYAKLAAASAIDSVVSGTCTLDQCSLCEEEPVSIMLQPCGHVNLCTLCGSRAKRCLKKECREVVAHIIRLCPVCLKNQADVTHRTCHKDHHRLCRACVSRSPSACVLCSSLVLRAPE